MRVDVASVARLEAANLGYGTGLDREGHRIEWIGAWRTMSRLRDRHDAGERVDADVEEWQVLAIDGEQRVALPPEAMAQRAVFRRLVAGR